MIKHTFSVAAEEGATSHPVAVNVPTFAEATQAQKLKMWDEAIRSVTIKVQGTLRRRLAKGIRGEALSKEAQAAFDAVMNGTRATAPSVVVDATALKLTRAQVDALTASGATVTNIPANLK